MAESSLQEGVDETRPLVLIAQDGDIHTSHLRDKLVCRFESVAAPSLEVARAYLAAPCPIVGAIVDTRFCDGDGFEFVAELRASNASLPLLLVSGSYNTNCLSRAHLAGVALVDRRDCLENLRAFGIQVNTSTSCSRNGIKEIIEDLTLSNRLSLRESQILAVAAHGVPRSRIARRLGTSENTIKTQIRSLLDKTQQTNLSEVVWLVHSRTELS